MWKSPDAVWRAVRSHTAVYVCRHNRWCTIARVAVAVVWFAALLCVPAMAAKELMYDEERGIIFVDKEKAEEDKEKLRAAQAPNVVRPVLPTSRSRSDIHLGRKKDPPELYFKSGLQYFKNGDYVSALKNFTFAKTVELKPEYLLWMGKTYRQMGRYDKMLAVMDEILEKFSGTDVADDALFEIAFYYQKHDDYHNATMKYTELAEQYPFGVSFSNGEEFLELSRTQRQLMRAEMNSALKVLGYQSTTQQDAYAAFQRANKFDVTGTPTRETVRAIKKQYERKIKEDTDRDRQSEQVSEATLWVSIVAGALLLNAWFILTVRARAKERKRQIETLRSLLSDLDTKTL